MRLISRNTLTAYAAKHPATEPSLRYWRIAVERPAWKTSQEAQAAFPKAKVLNAERVRYEIAGGDYRLIAAFDYKKQIAWVKFIGTHAEYDKIDALIVSLF